MKKILYSCIVLLLFLSGCSIRTVGDMYSLPKRSSESRFIQAAIDAAMVNFDYSAPLMGDNQQTVQMADLTGNGQDEYIVFAKGATEKPLHILIFSENEDGNYAMLDDISCNGYAFERVDFVQIDGQPGMEMVVGRQLSNQVMRIASIYSCSAGQPEQIMSTIYSRYLLCDLDGDSENEFAVIRSGEKDSDSAIAVMYQFERGLLERSTEVTLSTRADSIRRVVTGGLYGGTPAVYISGVTDENAVATDILAIKDSTLVNVAYSGENGAIVSTLRNYYVYAEDIDSDGEMELPRLVSAKSASLHVGTSGQYLIRWYTMDLNGEMHSKMCTFHNYMSGWYIQLENDWTQYIAVEQEGTTYAFYMWDEQFTQAQLLFTVYTLTGKDRESQASTQEMLVLCRTEGVSYAAKREVFAEKYQITDEMLINSFHLISQTWKTGEM